MGGKQNERIEICGKRGDGEEGVGKFGGIVAVSVRLESDQNLFQ